ncbi:MAG: DUF6745 domain-containing protein [Pseudomonadota bacterium]
MSTKPGELHSRASVGDSVWDSVGDSVWDSVRRSAYGQHEAAWLAFYRFFHEHVGLQKETEKLNGLWELSASCGWIYPAKNVCLASERHSICALNRDGLVHAESGPAIQYPDGFAIYAFNGVRLPEAWVMDKDNVNPEDVLRHANVEVRAAGAACLGWERMLSKLDSRTIDDTGDPDKGHLLEVNMPGLSRPGRFLRALCPRNGWIMLGVPFEIDTTLKAQAWIAQKDPSQFTYPEMRT